MANSGARRISIANLVDHPNEPPHDQGTPATSVSSVSPDSGLPHSQRRAYSPQTPQSQQVRPPLSHSISIHHARSAHFAPHPYRVQSQPQQHSPIEYETQFSPSNRRDVPVTNQAISFVAYDPNDAKKSKPHQHRASASRKSDVEYLFVNSSAPSTSGAPTVAGGASTSSAGGKVKKERAKPKNSSISGPSTIAAAGPPKPRRPGSPSKKPSRESQTSGEFSAISSTVDDPFGSSENQVGMSSRHNIASLMNAAPTSSDNPTPASDRNSVAPSATPGPEPSPGTESEKSPVSVDQSWSAPAEIGRGHIPADTTADDDIMADLEMAEQKPRKRTKAAPPLPPPQASPTPPTSTTTKVVQKRDEELQMELEMEIFQGMEESPKKLLIPPHVQPSSTPKKSGSRSSIASPSPAPSSFTPSRTPVPTAPPTTAKKSGTKAAAKPKAKAPAKKKADTVKGKGGGGGGGGGGGKAESDWTWGGTSSGRAAAAAAANALLGGGYGEDGYSGRESVPPVHVREEEIAEDDEEDDKRLYCVCRELYDNRFMLGCDNCDEWFHPPCLGMEDFQCDLLEHFYCASCRKADPSLKTTWRIRCANGQQHPYPDTADACWKAALPPLSKYCSTECGMDAMERRIAPIVCANAGMGQVAEGELLIPRTPAVKVEMSRLWRGVKDARKRDAVVVPANTSSSQSTNPTDIRPSISVMKAPPQRTDAERLTVSLKELAVELENLTNDSHLRSRELEFILARGRLARLAVQWSDKGENVSRCCFDARLLLEGIEWEEWVEGVGRSVLEGTADTAGPTRIGPNHVGGPSKNDGRVTSSVTGTGEEELLHLEMEAADSPWCDGRRKCERHFGWQKLCLAEFELNKGIKELALQGLATKQKEVQTRRNQIQKVLEALQTAHEQQKPEANNAKLEHESSPMVGVSA